MRKKTKSLIYPLLIMGVVMFLFGSCEKDDDNDVIKQIPILKTAEVTKIGQITAQSGGIITSDAGFAVTVRGVCWNTTGNPSITDTKTTDGLGAGSFTSKLTGLTVGTTYYLRAYATNSEGTAYGSTMIFETLGSTFTDSRDENVYKMVTIGDQIWMAENLAYAPSSGNYWAYDNDDANVETYGYLYDWETALDVCPTGWHLPSDEEWKELEMALGMSQTDADDSGFRGTNEGSKLAGNAGLWTNGALVNDEDFATSGFSALPGGYCNGGGDFSSIGNYGYWWSVAEYYTNYAWFRSMNYNFSNVARSYYDKGMGFSVRCVRD